MLLGLKVKAGAKCNSVDGFIVIDGKRYLKLSIKTPPENGKANSEIIKFLSSYWRLKKKDLEIISGFSSSMKILSINAEDDLTTKLI